MRNHRLFAAVGGGLILGAAALEYGLGPLAVAKIHRLPVETFPAKLGGWHAGDVQPTDADVQARLPTAKILDRPYEDGSGRTVDVMLVTASDSLDIHSPLDCFPSQGWKLSGRRTVVIGGQPVNVMDAQLDDQKMTVTYWTTGYYAPPPSRYALVRAASTLRTRLIGRREAESLFVRLIAPATPAGEQGLAEVTALAVPPVRALVEAGARPESSS